MNDSTASIHALFASTQVDSVVWQERIDDVAPPGATFVDVVVTSRPATLLRQTWYIGLAYLPGGPVVKGVQRYEDGQSLVFRNVLVKRGAVLALVAEDGVLDQLSVSVSVEPSGTGEAAARQRSPDSPVSEVTGLVTALAVLAGLLLAAYVATKVS